MRLASPPSRRLRLGLLALGVLALACDKKQTLKLPDPAPAGDLAFGVLYDADRPAVVGPMVRRAAVYSGRYSLEGDAGLLARLFFIRADDLDDAATVTCDARASEAERRLCRDRIQTCVDAPEACWKAAVAETGCGELMELGPNLPVEAYATEDGRLARVSEDAAPGITICGPPLDAGCPNRRAGYAITEGGRLTCIGEVYQIDCDVRVDLAACGLPNLEGTLSAQGELQLAAEPGCAPAAPDPSDTPFGTVAELALTCGSRTYAFHPQDGLLTIPQCPRRGPGLFETDAPTSGRITGAMALRVADSAPRLVLTGTGRDDCANFGCQFRGDSCNDECVSGCSSVLLIEPCARNSWAECAPVSEVESCLNRCRSFCARPVDARCYEDTAGLALTLSAPDNPEVDRFMVDLDVSGNGPATGHPMMATLPGGWMWVVTQSRLDGFTADGADQLSRRINHEASMTNAGLVAYGDDVLALFGTVDGVARVERLRLTRGTAPEVTAEGEPIEVPGLGGTDVGARGGRFGDWLFLAATQARLSQPPPRDVYVIDLDQGAVLPAITLPGRVTSLTSLPSGAVLAGFIRDDDSAALAVLVPGPDRVEDTHIAEVVGGVRLTAATLDPVTCSASAPSECRIFVGLEPTSGAGPALLGALEYDAGNPASVRLRASFQATAAQTVSQIVIDEDGQRLWAVAGPRNLLTPMLRAD